jgi:hypothetical protein
VARVLERQVNYLRVKNWEEHQHYKDRNPPWIKLHRALLADYEFCQLADDAKAHLLLIWVLASQSEGRVPADPAFLAHKIGARKRPRLDELIRAGFLIPEQDASTVLADRKQDASESLSLARSQEKRTTTTEAETEAEKSTRASPKLRLPANFAISERVRKWAEREGHSRLEAHFAHFVGKARAKGYTYADWDEGFMGAVRENWAKLPPANGLTAVGAQTAQSLAGWIENEGRNGTNGP